MSKVRNFFEAPTSRARLSRPFRGHGLSSGSWRTAVLAIPRYHVFMAFARETMLPKERAIRPLRRAEYDRLVRLGMLDSEPVELLYGRLVQMSPQGEAHAFSITRLTKLLVRELGDRADVRVQAPFVASDISEPEPDIALVPPGDYLDEHPSRAFLLIEVANSSLMDDRGLKSPLYAAAGVPEYWIVDLAGGAVEVHADPRGDQYATVTRHGREALLPLPGFADVVVRVGAILPP